MIYPDILIFLFSLVCFDVHSYVVHSYGMTCRSLVRYDLLHCIVFSRGALQHARCILLILTGGISRSLLAVTLNSPDFYVCTLPGEKEENKTPYRYLRHVYITVELVKIRAKVANPPTNSNVATTKGQDQDFRQGVLSTSFPGNSLAPLCIFV